MPRPSRSTLMRPRSAQSSLSHWTTTRPGMDAGSSGTTESSWPWQTIMPPRMLAQMAGHVLYALDEFQKFADARISRDRSPASPNFLLVVLSGSFHSPTFASVERLSSVALSKPNTLPTSRAAERPR